MYSLTFISEADFRKHVAKTLKSYDDSLKSIDLGSLNSSSLKDMAVRYIVNNYKLS